MTQTPSHAGAHPALVVTGPFAQLDSAQTAAFDPLLHHALEEDAAASDVTTGLIVDASSRSKAAIVSRVAGVVAGLPIAARVFTLADPRISVKPQVHDGDRVAAGTVLATVEGSTRGVLSAERVALNILGRLSGIATLTRAFVDAVGTHPAHIADTRKTTPGLRALERYAVRAGGGVNHRFDLAGAVLVKDNHIAAAGSVSEAVRRVRAGGTDRIVEVECDSVAQVREALAAGVDAVLLDNMDDAAIRECVGLARGRAAVEASGGMALERIPEVAATGVHVISIGALTHSAPALDVGLDFSGRPAAQQAWVNQHMGRTSKETAARLLSTAQPEPPPGAPLLTLRAVRARCVAGGASNFWIINSEAAEPVLSGDFPLTGMSPTAYFVQAAQYNNLPYAVRRADLTPDNHEITGDTSALEAAMREVYGEPPNRKPQDQPRVGARVRPDERPGGVRE